MSLSFGWSTNKKTLRRTGRGFRRLAAESLEQRIVLTTTLYLDFGAGFAAGGMNTTVGDFRDIDGANTGTNMTNGTIANPTGMNAGDALNLARLDYDFDGNGIAGEVADVAALAAAIVPLVQRAIEPFDIDIVVAAAGSLADAVASLGANNGDASGEFDAYNFITTVTSGTLVTGANPTGSVGESYGLYGRAAGLDLNAQAGNNTDEATMEFADQLLADTTGTPGTASFNQNLAARIAYTATHEAFHTFTYVHSVNLEASGDVIRLGSNMREDPFIITRFDLSRQGGFVVTEPNNYLLAANDPDIGLRDSDNDTIPDLAYATGTGAHDEITLSDAGSGIVDVDVDAYSNTARTVLIASESYSIDLAAETERDILVDASINVDEVVIDATINAGFRLRGGTGLDGPTTEADLLTLQNGGLTGTYTPGPSGTGTVVYSGGANIDFSEFENIQANGIPIDVLPLTLTGSTLNEGDMLTLSGAFVNIDTLDTHEVTIQWGDGSSNAFTLTAGQRTFSNSHTYDDDNPTATPFDVYDIIVTVTDQDDGVGVATAGVTVNNVLPAITTLGSDATFANKGRREIPSASRLRSRTWASWIRTMPW